MPTLDELLAESQEQSATPDKQAPPAVTLDSLLTEPNRSPTTQVVPTQPVAPVAPIAGAPAGTTLDNLLLQVSPELDTSQDDTPDPDKQNALMGFMQDYYEGVGNSLVGRTVKSAIKTLASSVKAPGEAIEATNYLVDPDGKPFEYSWSAPLASTLVGTKNLVQDLENQFLPDRQVDPEAAWYESLPEGLGSVAAFLGGGAALKSLGLSTKVATGLLGATIGGSQQYEEALTFDATEDQELLALVGGAGVGLTEILPTTFFLKKLDSLTGGQVRDRILKYNLNKEPGAWLEGLKGLIFESGQEGAQQIGTNWVASDLAAYEPNRSLGENFWASTLTGGLIGGGIGYGLGIVQNSQRNQVVRELEDIFNQIMASGNPINDIAGAFTPVQMLVQLQKAYDDVKRQLDAEGEKLTAGITPDDYSKLDDAGIEPKLDADLQKPSFLGYNAFDPAIQGFLASPVDEQVEKVVAKNPDGTVKSVEEALNETPIVVAEVQLYKQAIASTAAASESTRDAINKWKAAAETEKDPQKLQRIRGLIKSNELELKNLKDNLVELQKKQRIAKTVMSQVKNYIAAWRSAMGMESKFVVADRMGKFADYFDPQTVSQTEGLFSTYFVSGAQTSFIFAKIEPLVDQLYYNKTLAITSKSDFRKLYEVLSHELGHFVAVTHVRRLLSTITNKGLSLKERQESFKIYAVLLNDYKTWLSHIAPQPIKKLLETQFAPERASDFASYNSDIIPFSSTARMPRSRKNYLASFDEFFAEMMSRYATQGQFADVAMTKFFQPVLAQYQELFKNLPELAKQEYGQNWVKFIESLSLQKKVKDELENLQNSKGANIMTALKKGVPGFEVETFAGEQQYLDKWNWGIKVGLNLVQMVKTFPHVSQWKQYLQGVMHWQSFLRNFQAEAVGTLENWRSLGKVEASLLTDVLYDEAIAQKRKPLAELQARLSGDGLLVYKQIREQLDRVLESMRQAALDDANKTFYFNEEALKKEVEEVNSDFDKMKAKGYFPFVRFGKYTITVRAKEALTYNGDAYKKGDLLSFPTFETAKERDAAISGIKAELGDKATVGSSTMRETDFAIQGMPRALMRVLRRKLELAKELTPEQAEAFDKLEAEATPFQSFRKQFLKKKNIHGYSRDAMRSYAYYIRSGAGHIARVKYADEMRQAMESMQESVEVIKTMGHRADDRQAMRDWLNRHFSYIMNPTNELAALRGVGFVAYLGFNIKSALVNLTQVIQFGYPYLAARYGDASAVSQLIKSTRTLQDWVRHPDKYKKALTQAEKDPIKFSKAREARIAKLIAQGLHEGWIDQSLATELAIAASENNLDRGLFTSGKSLLWHNISKYSALPFHLVEKINRYTMAVATYELEYAKTQNHDKAVVAAREANWSVNFENSRWNRPEFMRGKKSAALLFGNFLQNAVFFAIKDPGKRRFYLILLLLAGIQGLPGADDIEDLVNFAATYLNRMLGIKSPMVNMKHEMREMLNELGANPDLILHGISQNSFGLGHVGELAGIPIPQFDLSASLGMGNILPLTEIPNQALLGTKPGDLFMRAAGSATGAGGNLIANIYTGLMSDDPDTWRRMEKLIPMASAVNVSKAMRYATRGKEETRSGKIIADFEPFDARASMEIAGQALGFTPSRVRAGWEQQMLLGDMSRYYSVQRTKLLKDHNWALYTEDREARADAIEAIREFNAAVPYPEMGISASSIRESARAYITSRAYGEAGIVQEKKLRRLEKQVQEAYPDPWGDKQRKEQGSEF